MAQLIEAACRPHNVVTFLAEKDIKGGDSINEVVRASLEECCECLVLLTRNSFDREWVLIEIGGAWVQKKRVVAIINHVLPSEMPDIISNHLAIDLNDFDNYVAQLVNRAKNAKAV